MTEKTNNQQPVLLYPQYPVQEDNEINLFDIWHTLMAYKKSIILITLFFSISSIIFALTSPKVWQAEIRFMPTLSSNILGLNGSTPSSLYKQFFINFNSLSLRKAFFTENNLINLYQEELSNEPEIRNIQITKAFETFNKDLVVNNGKEGHYVTATLILPDQKLASELLNKYSQLIHKYTLNTILNEIEKSYSYKRSTIETQIKFLKDFNQQNLEDKIHIIDEAIHAATLLGIENAKLETLDNQSNLTTLTNQAKISAISSFLYLRGYKALKVEKEMLLKRKDNIAFIAGIRSLEQEDIQLQEKLNRILKSKDSYKIIGIDQKAIEPIKALKPNKRLIVILGTILGGSFSLIVVIFLNIRKKYMDNYKV